MSKKVHHNLAQIEYLLIQASVTVLIWGRGTGKSKPLAHRLKSCAEYMPRSITRFAGYTYEGLLNSILPGVIETWQQDYGWIEGVHYWVNQWAPKELNIPKPYFAPQGWGKHLIHVYNGSVIMLTSMDRAIYNGSNYDAFVGDEVRLYKNGQHRLGELWRAMRGNKVHFGDCWLHGSIMMASDRPQDQSGNFILEYKELMDPQAIHIIEKAAYRLSQLKQIVNELSGEELATFKQRIVQYEKYLNELRKHVVHFSEASTLENIHALGIDFLLRTKRDSTPFEYNTAILNLDIDKIEDGFYPLLDHQLEYHAPNYVYQDTIPDQHKGTAVPTWKWYNDYKVNEPLHIAFDHNHHINWVVTGQPFPERGHFKIQSSDYVEKPDYIQQCVERWCEFYKDFPTKRVIYYYDSTHIKGNAQGNKSEMQLVIDTLKANKWRVKKKYLSSPSLHNYRYSLNQVAMRGEDPDILQPQFNASTNRVLLKGMKQVGVKITEGEYKKNKDTEKKDKHDNYKVPPPLAPHGSEAYDVLMTGINRFRHRSVKAFISAISR